MPEAKPMYSLEEIRTSIELSLRKSGIKVANTDAIPVLFFRVHSLKVPNDASYIHNISMYLRQDTFFARANRAGRTALVSASGRLDVSSYVGASGFHRIRETLNEAAQQLTDAFLNEWYKDNQ